MPNLEAAARFAKMGTSILQNQLERHAEDSEESGEGGELDGAHFHIGCDATDGTPAQRHQ